MLCSAEEIIAFSLINPFNDNKRTPTTILDKVYKIMHNDLFRSVIIRKFEIIRCYYFIVEYVFIFSKLNIKMTFLKIYVVIIIDLLSQLNQLRRLNHIQNTFKVIYNTFV